MIVHYKNTLEDYEKGYESLFKASKRVTLLQTGIGMLGILILAFYHFYEMSTFYNIGARTYLKTILMISVIYMVFYFLVSRKLKKAEAEQLDKLIELNPSMLGDKSLELCEDKLILKCDTSYLEHNIKAIDNVIEKDDRVILCIHKLNPVYIIPCKYFSSEDEKCKFIELVKSSYNKTKNNL